MRSLAEWFDEGTRTLLQGQAGHAKRRLFYRTSGQGDHWTTFFHGFPTSSWDWARVDERLGDDGRRLFLDHLGFGFSDKPVGHRFRLVEQLDFAVALWRELDIQRTWLVCHDYSVSIAQELLARQLEGQYRGPEITGILFLNGGLFYSRQRPLPIQKLLRSRWTGPVVSKFVTWKTFETNMKRIHHHSHPWDDDELRQHWDAIQANEGRRVYHPVSKYHYERQQQESRWEQALGRTEIPIALAWGDADPISGREMSEYVRVALPEVPVTAWDDVGHYPQIEAPDRVTTEIRALRDRETKAPGTSA